MEGVGRKGGGGSWGGGVGKDGSWVGRGRKEGEGVLCMGGWWVRCAGMWGR